MRLMVNLKTERFLTGSRCRWALGILCGMAILISTAGAHAQNRVHTVFHEGTDHALHVYRIYGKQPGKTLLLIGGIQGDEPGGFISADHYADLSLVRGNLIVVPRANFQSIVLQQRKINEDMNRKFDEDHQDNYEAKIVKILKTLIRESDCLLNLHDGSGFYSETWENNLRNPSRYGQSIIADCEVYVDPVSGKRIELGQMARSVVEKINREIQDPKHHFHFNNHRTGDADSPNKEQRKSATYYALYSCGIPAFGVETSKRLTLDLKVRHHNLAINAFMDRLGIVPETPGLNLDEPELRYLVISVNNSLPVAVEKEQTLFINPEDTIRISHIEANYERGLSADIMDHGTMNDLRKKVSITQPTRIVVRKDYYPCGVVYLAFGDSGTKPDSRIAEANGKQALPDRLFYKIRVNGKEQYHQNYAHVPLLRGDQLELVDVFSSFIDSADMIVNFKGYVGSRSTNTGEDRGFVIDTGRDLWARYSLQKMGRNYQVVVKHNGKAVGKLFVDLEEPQFDYLLLHTADQGLLRVMPEETVTLSNPSGMEIVELQTNVENNSGVGIFLTDLEGHLHRLRLREPFELNDFDITDSERKSKRYRLDIQRGDISVGVVHLELQKETIIGQKSRKHIDH